MKHVFEFLVFLKARLNGETQDINKYLLNSKEVPEQYDVTQPSVYNVIGHKGIKRATVIEKYAYTITTRQRQKRGTM